MKTKKSLFFIIFAYVMSSLPVHAASLDDIYRDLVRSDNRGYLPMFVKNRNTPDFLLDDETMKQITVQEAPQSDIKAISLENERKKKEEALLAAQLKWTNALLAVKNNRVTPVELEEIQKRVDENNPEAIEIFAWMNSRGVGILPDLIKAFNLYQRAAALNVPNANKNAAQVYKIMTRVQRESLNTFQK